jgi:hypothetical protein
MSMKRKHWGDLPKDNDEEKLARINDIDKKIIIEKRSELKILHSSVFLEQVITLSQARNT